MVYTGIERKVAEYGDSISVNVVVETVEKGAFEGVQSLLDTEELSGDNITRLEGLSGVRIDYWVDNYPHHFRFSGGLDDGSRYSSRLSGSHDDDSRVTHSGGLANGARWMALCWAAVISRAGVREVPDNGNLVPVDIAALGKPYIAAFLFSGQRFDITEIATKLEISEGSVEQYLRDVVAQRR